MRGSVYGTVEQVVTDGLRDEGHVHSQMLIRELQHTNELRTETRLDVRSRSIRVSCWSRHPALS